MSVDDLSTPLGVDPGTKKAKRSLNLGKPLLGVALLTVAGLGAFLLLTHDPLGGEPSAVATIVRQPAAIAAVAPNPTQPASQPDAAPAGNRSTAAELEQDSGVKVVRQNGGAAPSAIIIRVPDAQPSALALAPDKRLVEKSRHGALPRIGNDGLKPFDLYARAPSAAARSRTAKIAIVIGGLGIGQSVTADAISKLPPDVSLAFAPYGNDLERQVQSARTAGHEVLLHLPMEPFDYPDNDPGPQTLLSSLTPTQNVDRLQWLMSRFTGYVGVMNFMGARLTSNETAIAPILREVGGRGLAYLDDGSSPRSLAVSLASGSGMPASRGDLVLDTVQRSSDIDASLAKLETIARERGIAIGTASALPITLDRIARWSRTLEAKGIALVPVSSTIAGPKT